MQRGIIQVQEDYLRTLNEDYLAELYIEVIKLAKVITRVQNLPLDEDDIYDLASNVVMRLKERRTPIVSRSPSAFIKHALYFKARAKQRLKDNNTVELPEELSVADRYFVQDEYDSLVREILLRVPIPEHLQQAVEVCLYTCQSITSVRKKITTIRDKQEFTAVMEEIRNYVSQKSM